MSPLRKQRVKELWELSIRLREYQHREKVTWGKLANSWDIDLSKLSNLAYAVSATDDTRKKVSDILDGLGA
jgi:hypothetical protein